jgi:uncharacterized protein (DUF433 family)
MKKPRAPITIDPDIHSGDPVFTGTRVPVVTLFDYLETGLTLEVFLHNFPSVTRENALRVLKAAESNLINSVRNAA